MVTFKAKTDRMPIKENEITALKTSDKDAIWKLAEDRMYPEDSKLSFCIVVSEFDIDTGSTVRYQYPNQIEGITEDSLAELMLPEGSHNRSEDGTYIFLNRKKMRLEEGYNGHERLNSDTFRYGFNLVQTKYDSSVRRGALIKAMAIFSSYRFVDCLKEPLSAALLRYFDNPVIDVLMDLHSSLNVCELSGIPRPNLREQNLMRFGISVYERSMNYTPSAWHHTLIIRSSNNEEPTMSVAIPLYRDLDSFGNISMTSFIRTFGKASMRIYSAIISKQRVIFVGYDHAARDICDMVLTAAALISPLPNILQRIFPYANLTDLSFLEVEGYIAGVTNPMFLERDSWWDLACVLDLSNGVGSVFSQEGKKRADEPYKGVERRGVSRSLGVTNQFLGDLLNAGGRLMPSDNSEAVQQHLQDAADSYFISGIISVISTKCCENEIAEEEWVQQRFYEYSASIIQQAHDLHPTIGLDNSAKSSRRLIDPLSDR